MILKLEGREKVNAHIIANKVNEIIDYIEEFEKNIKEKVEEEEDEI